MKTNANAVRPGIGDRVEAFLEKVGRNVYGTVRERLSKCAIVVSIDGYEGPTNRYLEYCIRHGIDTAFLDEDVRSILAKAS